MADYVLTLALMKVILSRWCVFNVLIAPINWFSAGLGMECGRRAWFLGAAGCLMTLLAGLLEHLGEAPLTWTTSACPAWVRGEEACGFCLSFNNSK